MKRVISSVLASMALLSCSAPLQGMEYFKKMRSCMPSYVSISAVLSVSPCWTMVGGGIVGVAAYVLAYSRGVFKDRQGKYVDNTSSSEEDTAGNRYSACRDYEDLMEEDFLLSNKMLPVVHAYVWVTKDSETQVANWVKGVINKGNELNKSNKGLFKRSYVNSEENCIISLDRSSCFHWVPGAPSHTEYTVALCGKALSELQGKLQNREQVTQKTDLPVSLQNLPDEAISGISRIISKYQNALKKDPEVSAERAYEDLKRAREARKKYALRWFHAQYGGFSALAGALLTTLLVKACSRFAQV